MGTLPDSLIASSKFLSHDSGCSKAWQQTEPGAVLQLALSQQAGKLGSIEIGRLRHDGNPQEAAAVVDLIAAKARRRSHELWQFKR